MKTKAILACVLVSVLSGCGSSPMSGRAERKSVASLAEPDNDNWDLDWGATSKGVKDFKSGLTWSRDQGNLMGQFQAQTHCAKKGMRLPEKKEIIEVSKRGFHEGWSPVKYPHAVLCVL